MKAISKKFFNTYLIEAALLVIWIGVRFIHLKEISLLIDDDILKWLILPEEILAGRWPIFAFEEDRSGALFAYLCTPFRLLFPNSVVYIYYVTLSVSIFFGCSLYSFTRRFFGRNSARFAIALIVSGPLLFVHWSVYACGEYITCLALMMLAIDFCFRASLLENQRKNFLFSSLSGLLLGLAIWSHLMALALIFPLLLSILFLKKRTACLSCLTFGIGLITGITPFILFQIFNSMSSALAVGQIITQDIITLLPFLLKNFFGYLSELLGISSRFLASILFILFVIYCARQVYLYIKKQQDLKKCILFVLICFTLMIILEVLYVLTPIDIDNTSRYLIGLYIPFSIIGGILLSNLCKTRQLNILAVVLITVLITCNFRIVLHSYTEKRDHNQAKSFYHNKNMIDYITQTKFNNSILITTPSLELEYFIKYLKSRNTNQNQLKIVPWDIDLLMSQSILNNKTMLVFFRMLEVTKNNCSEYDDTFGYDPKLHLFSVNNVPCGFPSDLEILSKRYFQDVVVLELTTRSLQRFIERVVKSYQPEFFKNPRHRRLFNICTNNHPTTFSSSGEFYLRCSGLYSILDDLNLRLESKAILVHGCNLGLNRACQELKRFNIPD